MQPRLAAGLFTLIVLLAACQPAPAPLRGATTEPAATLRGLAQHLRRNDLQGFASAAVPPSGVQALERAWRDDRSRWPLSELPLDERLPGLLATLSAPDAERRLGTAFDRQFAGQARDLRAGAHALTLFGTQYVQYQGGYAPAQRSYYAQLIQALGQWAQDAPLADATRAHLAIRQLVVAARRTGLAGEDGLRTAGMGGSLQRLGPFAATCKSVLGSYGLDLDHSLDQLRTGLVSQSGDQAQVELRYPLGPREVRHTVPMQRRDGRWYVAAFLARADAAQALAPAALPAPAVPAEPPLKPSAP